MEFLMTNLKTRWREHYRQLLQNISPQERERASQLLAERLFPIVHHQKIASFLSTPYEINTAPLHHLLAQEDLLILPFSAQIDPVLLKDRTVVLVPALAFDKRGFRLGLGRGFYDRAISQYQNIQWIGVGFASQLHPADLPTDPWDQKVSSLILV